jgi:hypothetical protein
MSQEAFEKLLKDNYQPTTHEEFLILLYRRIFEHEKKTCKTRIRIRKNSKISPQETKCRRISKIC